MYVGVRAGGGIGDEIEDPAGDEFEVERIVFDITFFFFVIVILLAIIQGESQGSVWPTHTHSARQHKHLCNLFQAWSSMPLESCVTSRSRWKKIWRWVWLTRNSLLRAFHQDPDPCHEFRLLLTPRRPIITACFWKLFVLKSLALKLTLVALTQTCVLAVLVSLFDVCQSSRLGTSAGVWRLCQI